MKSTRSRIGLSRLFRNPLSFVLADSSVTWPQMPNDALKILHCPTAASYRIADPRPSLCAKSAMDCTPPSC